MADRANEFHFLTSQFGQCLNGSLTVSRLTGHDAPQRAHGAREPTSSSRARMVSPRSNSSITSAVSRIIGFLIANHFHGGKRAILALASRMLINLFLTGCGFTASRANEFDFH